MHVFVQWAARNQPSPILPFAKALWNQVLVWERFDVGLIAQARDLHPHILANGGRRKHI